MLDDKEKTFGDIEWLRGNARKITNVAANLQKALQSYNQGDLALALEFNEEAILLNPEYASAYVMRGMILMSMERFDEARNALLKAVQLQPDVKNAKYYLAALGHGEAPYKSPETYVGELFDDYADRFNEHLVDKLGYQVPQHLYDITSTHLGGNKRKLDILDLGCGTGLCGIAFASLARSLVGIDLSRNMINKAGELGIYSKLIQGDISSILQKQREYFDLVLSGDVFIYIGDLSEVFRLIKDRLNSDGLFAFSIEVNNSEENYKVQPSCRYEHSPEYIQRLCTEFGLDMIDNKTVTLRYNRATPVAGKIIVLRSVL